MKKTFALTLLMFLAIGVYTGVSARTQYDSTGRHIIQNDTIRGRRQAAYEQAQQKKNPPAAAAKIDYDAAIEALNNRPKSTYYQSSEAYKKKHNIQ